MNIADKIALANTMAAYLNGTAIALAEELHDRGHAELAIDDEFTRLMGERCWRCPDCGAWTADDGQWADGHPPCPGCDDDDWEEYE